MENNIKRKGTKVKLLNSYLDLSAGTSGVVVANRIGEDEILVKFRGRLISLNSSLVTFA